MNPELTSRLNRRRDLIKTVEMVDTSFFLYAFLLISSPVSFETCRGDKRNQLLLFALFKCLELK